MLKQHRKAWAFTLIELLIVVAVIAILAVMLLPALAKTKASDQYVSCAHNLEQVGVAFRTWALDNGDTYPMRVSTTAGGYSDFVGVARTVAATQPASKGAFGFFMCMSNELNTPKVVFCPAEPDSVRQTSTTFSGTVPVGSAGIPFTNDMNISYFVGVDAVDTLPQMFLDGDHNLGSGNPPTQAYDGPYPAAGTYCNVSLGTNFPPSNNSVGWLDNMHQKQGNVGLADGSVYQFSRSRLQDALKHSGDLGGNSNGTFPNPFGASPANVNRIEIP